ncbi:hypothetical protein KR026_009840 [Drosophila bipectinata]|nr:hypothetical protein KR026_009840 [Drosophila bipectinata]
MRGMRKCPHCGAFNGNRAGNRCGNVACPQYKNVLDAVQLVCLRPGISLYSLRSKEKDYQPRNFVVIEDITLSLHLNAAVVSSKAECHAENCKQSAVPPIRDCIHVKSCRDLGTEIAKAQVYHVTREVLWNLNIREEQKLQLWQLYKQAEEQERIPAVQRLNASTFVVKCERSESFPAARLHVTVMASGTGYYACVCKKLKIIVEPDNSLVMQDEICDHLLLVLAGILSSPEGKRIYGNFIGGLQSFWMPLQLETPLGEAIPEDLQLSLAEDFNPQVDILVFRDHLDFSMPDLSEGVFNLDNLQAAGSSQSTSTASNALVHYANDSQLLSNCNFFGEPIELTDCNIELMDQFQPTDQIDLTSEEIQLPLISEPYNILAAPSVFAESTPAVVSDQLPIELATIAVVKKTPVKVSEIVDEVKSRKQPPLPAKRDLIVNNNNKNSAAKCRPITESIRLDPSAQPSLAYSAWLEHVIELLNEGLKPAESPPPGVSMRINEHDFHVHREIFSHFCKTFSAGIKRRPLDKIVQIEAGKYKGLTKYVWHFTTAHNVKRIFTTSNMKIQLDRAFECGMDGKFVPYVRPVNELLAVGSSRKRPMYRRLKLYMTRVIFEDAPKEQKGNGLLVTWIANVLPQSQFGLLHLELAVETKSPQ